jgi:hypothetical protein
MTRKQFLMAFLAAPLAALGLNKPAPAGLRHVRVYDVRTDRFVNYFEGFCAREGFRTPPLCFHRDALVLQWPKVGETIHVRTPPNFITYRWK